MPENNFLKRMFKIKTKEEKELKKLYKMKKEFDDLEIKYMKGTIANSELEKYNKLSEEIRKMSKKFEVKDGKLMLRQSKEKENVEQKNVVEEQPVNPEQVLKQDEQQQQIQQQAMAQHQEMQRRQAMAQQQAIAQQQELQRRQAMAQQQELQRRQAMAQQQMIAQQEELQRRQAMAQQEAMAQQQQEQHVEAHRPRIKLFVMDLPEMELSINNIDIPVFEKQLKEAIANKDVFRFGNFNIIPDKILMYQIV